MGTGAQMESTAPHLRFSIVATSPRHSPANRLQDAITYSSAAAVTALSLRLRLLRFYIRSFPSVAHATRVCSAFLAGDLSVESFPPPATSTLRPSHCAFYSGGLQTRDG